MWWRLQGVNYCKVHDTGWGSHEDVYLSTVFADGRVELTVVGVITTSTVAEMIFLAVIFWTEVWVPANKGEDSVATWYTETRVRSTLHLGQRGYLVKMGEDRKVMGSKAAQMHTLQIIKASNVFLCWWWEQLLSWIEERRYLGIFLFSVIYSHRKKK